MEYNIAIEKLVELYLETKAKKGLSRRKVSKISGVDCKTLSSIEKGFAVPRLDTMVKLLSACGYEVTLKIVEKQN